MRPRVREAPLAPSEWNVVLAPELAPLFVIEAVLVATDRLLANTPDTNSRSAGGCEPPPTRALLRAMQVLRSHFARHRLAEDGRCDTTAAESQYSP